MKYKGVLARYYGGRAPADGVPGEWWSTVGSYEIEIDAAKATYNSFAVTPTGGRVQLKWNKDFKRSDLEAEVRQGHLTEVGNMDIAKDAVSSAVRAALFKDSLVSWKTQLTVISPLETEIKVWPNGPDKPPRYFVVQVKELQ